MPVVAEEVIGITPAAFISTVNTLALKADLRIGPMKAKPVYTLDPKAAFFRVTFKNGSSRGYIVAS